MLKLRKIACAISGGVDSCIAALLLRKKGYEIIGVFMRNWDITDEVGNCTVDQDAEDAHKVCKQLGIPFHEVSFIKEYWHEVFSHMVNDYENGLTPNPDILCNKRIKFDALFKHCTEKLGVDALATGHYARSTFGDELQNFSQQKGARLLRALDTVKDQTFFLSQISQASLQHAVFPLGEFTKDVVKKIALTAGFESLVKKKESMGICFIGKRNFQDFIDEYIDPQPGLFIHMETGEVIGEHLGIHQWTIGQRCRLPGKRTPFYIVQKNKESQEMLVIQDCDHPALYCTSVFLGQPHWIHSTPRMLMNNKSLDCSFVFQHTKPLVPCSLNMTTNGCLIAYLAKPLRAVTPGQYGVFYKGDECLGSARILHPGPSLYAMSNKPKDRIPISDSEIQNSQIPSDG